MGLLVHTSWIGIIDDGDDENVSHCTSRSTLFAPRGRPPHLYKLSSSSFPLEAMVRCGEIQATLRPRGGAGVQPWFLFGFRL